MPAALVLGGYGLIGSACCRALARDGFHVIGLGRSQAAAAKCQAPHDWLFDDLATMDTAAWTRCLDGVDVVINAAGAL